MLQGVKAELEDKHKDVHDIPDPRVLARRRKMPAEMEGHAMSLTSATTWARSGMASEHKEQTDLGDSVRACELADPSTMDETPTRRKTRSGNEAYEVDKWGHIVDRTFRQRIEV